MALSAGSSSDGGRSPAAPPDADPSAIPRRPLARRPPAKDFATQALPHLDRIFALARVVARPPLDAEDLTQETFARACAAYHRFAPGSDMRAWLTTILLNLVRGDARRRRMEVVPLSDAGHPPEQSCEVVALRNLDRTSVLAAVARLPEEFRTAISVVDLAGLSVREAAAVLDVPVGTVLSRLSRGRARLGRLLGGVVAVRKDDP